MKNIQVGEVVKALTGPYMTVRSIHNGIATVQWFSGKHSWEMALKEGKFAVASLHRPPAQRMSLSQFQSLHRHELDISGVRFTKAQAAELCEDIMLRATAPPAE